MDGRKKKNISYALQNGFENGPILSLEIESTYTSVLENRVHLYKCVSASLIAITNKEVLSSSVFIFIPS